MGKVERSKAWTIEVESYDGEAFPIGDLREALEREGFKLQTSTIGRHLLGRELLEQARERLAQAAELLEIPPRR